MATWTHLLGKIYWDYESVFSEKSHSGMNLGGWLGKVAERWGLQRRGCDFCEKK